MSYRVFDKKKKRWVNDVFLTPDGELIKQDKNILGWSKPTFVSENRYVFQQAIDLYDKNNELIFVGDYLEAEVANEKIVRGLVAFAEELGCYVILCFENDEYYVLSQAVCSKIQIIGNVFKD